jgi:hypothetical protein
VRSKEGGHGPRAAGALLGRGRTFAADKSEEESWHEGYEYFWCAPRHHPVISKATPLLVALARIRKPPPFFPRRIQSTSSSRLHNRD